MIVESFSHRSTLRSESALRSWVSGQTHGTLLTAVTVTAWRTLLTDGTLLAVDAGSTVRAAGSHHAAGALWTDIALKQRASGYIRQAQNHRTSKTEL